MRVPTLIVLFVAPLLSGCLSPAIEGEIGIRVENHAEGAVGLSVTFEPAAGATLNYTTALVARRGEVGTHITPLDDGNYTVEVVLTQGPGTNAQADVNDLPPAETASRLELALDSTGCAGLALAVVLVQERGVLGAGPMRCER